MWSILLLASIAAVSAVPKEFNGDKVFRVFPQNEEHIQLIKSIAGNTKEWEALRALTVDKEYRALFTPTTSIPKTLDFWIPETVSMVTIGQRADFRVEFDMSYDVLALLEKSEMPFEILIGDLQVAVNKQRDSNIRAVHSYEKYNDLDTINEWSANIAAQNPSLVSRSQLGTSYEGRPIYILKVGKSGANKKAVFIDCGFHAREWISPAFCQYFVKEAVGTYGSDAQFTNLLNSLDFYVVPVLNVDGYAYTWSRDRMWRKTRSVNSGSSCIGTDPNRNFNAGWCTVGASSKACDETYCGTAPESERETKALADFIRNNIASIKGYLTIHSYSQMVLFPYSYSYAVARDHNELNTVAKNAVDQLYSLHKTRYTYGPGGTTIYLAAGGSDDWAYDAGVKYSFTFELRDEGRYGFLLPESQIKATNDETLLAIKSIANHILNNA